ncbi:uncharacterized protein LOC131875169 [Cryptomeria japonica]|uniref:uncharacterized protein LOC131875169 n=1 Tax=Cryptomeria japonica TaxID=3369 RepID=UPI0027DA7F7D|nr:uncharacterized protein LOC131875169 [Cryptomeria japonica]
MAKLKMSKPVSTPPKKSKPRQSQSAPTSGVQKPVPPPKSQTTSTDGAKKRKKEKPQREYGATTIEDIETEYDEVAKEVKKTTTYARVVKNPQFGCAQPTKKPREEADPSGRTRSNLMTHVPEVHEAIPDKQKDQSSEKAILEVQPKDPPVIEIVSEKETEETNDTKKGEDDGEEGEKDEIVEVVENEKGEKKEDQVPVTVARDFVTDKCK